MDRGCGVRTKAWLPSRTLLGGVGAVAVTGLLLLATAPAWAAGPLLKDRRSAGKPPSPKAVPPPEGMRPTQGNAASTPTATARLSGDAAPGRTVKQRPSARKLRARPAASQPVLPRDVPDLVAAQRFDAAMAALVRRPPRSAASGFLLGYLRLQRGAPAAALPSLRHAVRTAWPLQGHALYFLAQAALDAGDAEASIAGFQSFLSWSRGADGAAGAQPFSRGYRQAARLGVALAYRRAGAYDQALRAFQAARQDAPAALQRQAAFGLARTLEMQGKLEAAALAYRALWLEDPTSPFADRAEAAEGRVTARLATPLPPPSEAALVERARLFAEERRFREAHLAAAATRLLYPEGALLTRLDLLEGISLYHLRRNHQGLGRLRSLLRRQATAPEALEARYWLMRFGYRLGERRTVFEQSDFITARHAASEFADNASFIKAAFLGDNGHLEEAASLYRAFLQRYPRSPLRPAAQWSLAWSLYRLQRYAEAEAAFLPLRRSTLGGERAAMGAYWSGRSLERLGSRESAAGRYAEVRRRWPETYPAIAAGQRLRQLGAPVEPPAPRLDASAGGRAEAVLDPVLLQSFPLTLRAYVELGLLERAASLATEELAPAEQQRLAAPLAHLLRAADRYDQAARLPTAAGEGTGVDSWRASYPRPYFKWAHALAAAEAIDPYLALAVMRNESRFNPKVVSPSGAVGLMQLMPETARAIALERGWNPPSRDDLLDPFTNLRYGFAELGRLARRFNGNLILTIAGYNAEPERVAAWWAERGHLEEDEFIASIPYTETRHYVQRVLASLHIYRRLYEEDRQARREVKRG